MLKSAVRISDPPESKIILSKLNAKVKLQFININAPPYCSKYPPLKHCFPLRLFHLRIVVRACTAANETFVLFGLACNQLHSNYECY